VPKTWPDVQGLAAVVNSTTSSLVVLQAMARACSGA
jgi:hypothetical protein